MFTIKPALFAFLISAPVSCLVLGCAEERPLRPEPTELRIYAGGIDYSQIGNTRSVIFMYDYDSLTVKDSIVLPAPSLDAVAGSDGRSLFVLTTSHLGPHSIWSIDPETKATRWGHDLSRWLDSPPGKGRLISINHGQWLLANREIISSQDGTVAKTLADSLVPFSGTSSGTAIAIGTIASGDTRARILRGYDVATDSSWGSYAPHLLGGTPLLPYFATLHPDGNRILTIGIVEPLLAPSWFVIGDLSTGSTLLQHALSYPFGEIIVSDDGTRAIVSDPSRTLIYDTWPTLGLFNVDSLRHLERISWDLSQPDHPTKPIHPGQLVWVPGSTEFVIAPPGDLNSAGSWMAVVDARDFSITRYFKLPGQSQSFEFFTGGLTVGEFTPFH